MNDQASLVAVILAAGKGKRMKSDLPKVLHEVGGTPMVLHVVNTAKSTGADRVIAILGHGKDQVINVLQNSTVEGVIQKEQLGTGHAVQQVEPLLTDFNGDILVLSGDVPLLRTETLRHMLDTHRQSGAGATVLTADFEDPTGYGRIVREPDGTLNRIVEHKDCSPEILQINEINTGVYLFQAPLLFAALRQVDNNNQQGEYYLPDALDHFPVMKKSVVLSKLKDPGEIQGVNTREQLLKINRIFATRHR